MLQPFIRYSGLMSLVFRSGLLASVTMSIASSNAFALNPKQALSVLPSNTTVAAEVRGEQPQESQPNVNTTTESRFSCETVNGQYTVMYHPLSQPEQAYAWANPSTLGGGWSPERRCNEISRRLESYRPDGLQQMRLSVENNYNIVCVTTQKDPSCRIVLTIPPNQDPQETRDRIFQNLTVADSGQDTQAVNTYAGNGSGSQLLDQVNRVVNQGLSTLGIGHHSTQRSGNINLRPFLDPADGGTGTQLHRR